MPTASPWLCRAAARSRFPSAAGSLRPGRQGDARRPAGASRCPRPDGELVGDVVVAERLGGETYLYIRRARAVLWSSPRPPAMIRPACMSASPLGIEPETCHLFDAEGRALPHLTRHPLAEMRPSCVNKPRRPLTSKVRNRWCIWRSISSTVVLRSSPAGRGPSGSPASRPWPRPGRGSSSPIAIPRWPPRARRR